MTEVAKNVMRARMNYGAPESMKLRESTKVSDVTGKTITIDEIVVSNKVKKDKDGNVVKTKDGEKEIYQPYIYVAYDGDFYFSTASQILLEQLEALSGQELRAYEKLEVKVKKVDGLKVLVSSEKVKYRDGKFYDQAIFNDAE